MVGGEAKNTLLWYGVARWSAALEFEDDKEI